MVLPNALLHVGSLNVQGGIANKSSLHDFVALVEKFDIVCIQESWLTNDTDFHISNYSKFVSNRKKSKKAKRGSGGVIMLFRSDIQNGIVKCASKSRDIIWAKLKKEFFGLHQDVYLACVYIRRRNYQTQDPVHTHNNPSVDHVNDIFDTLQDEVSYYESQGGVLIVLDLNSRIGCLNEKHFTDIYSTVYRT